MQELSTLTEDQVFLSVSGGRSATVVSDAISKAEEMVLNGGGNITVVCTVDGDIRLYSEYQMIVAKGNIASAIYTTDGGFMLSQAA